MKNFKIVIILIIFFTIPLFAENSPQIDYSLNFYLINIKQLLRYAINLNKYRNYEDKFSTYRAQKIKKCKENNNGKCPDYEIKKIDNEYRQLLNQAKMDIEEYVEQIRNIKINLEQILNDLELYSDKPIATLFSRIPDKVADFFKSDLYKKYKKIKPSFKKAFPEECSIVEKYLSYLIIKKKKINLNAPIVPGAKL